MSSVLVGGTITEATSFVTGDAFYLSRSPYAAGDDRYMLIENVDEHFQDLMASTLVAGSNISVTYNDGAGTIMIAYTGATPPATTDDLPEGVTNLYYTDERAQDAVGAMIDSTLVYVDGTPLLTRAALTGEVTAPQGSNALTVVQTELAGLKALSSNGLVTRTAAGTYAARSIAAGTGLGVTNGDGVSGNPTVAVTDAELLAIAGLSSAANTMIQFTGSGAAQLLSLVLSSYTPTITNTANLDSTTGGTYSYIRLGDKVLVWGFVTADPTAAANTQTRFRMTLPVASNFTSSADCAGGVFAGAVQRAGRVSGDTTNDAAQFDFASENTAAVGFAFIFIYVVK